MVTRFSLLFKSSNYKKSEDIYAYVINEFVLVLLELVLNIKFIILNDANEMTTISLLEGYGSKYNKNYLDKIKTSIKSKSPDKAESKISMIDGLIRNYDPKEIIFVKKTRYYIHSI